MIDLQTPIAAVPRLRKTTVEKFSALGLATAEDLLWRFPFRYEDFSRITPIREIQAEKRLTIRGTVKSIINRPARYRRMRLTEAVVSDDGGSVHVLWFNQPYLTHVLKSGDVILAAGKAKRAYGKLTMLSPAWEKEKGGADRQEHVGRIVPVYSVTKDLTVKTLRSVLAKVLPLAETVEEILPAALIRERGLLPRGKALHAIHYPETRELLTQAKARFAYEELLLIQLSVLRAKRLLATLPALPIPRNTEALRAFLAQFPFQPTGDQKKAAWKILKDMEKPQPMNRLLQGDVGSGKTLVAELALLTAGRAGFQAALLAPTEILAKQHFARLREHFSATGSRVGFLTGSAAVLEGKPVNRAAFERACAEHGVDLLIGTHALLGDRIAFAKLGLIVIDEQHRFGVEQRKILREQSMKRRGTVPHFLSMTATPIPRSLSLTLYGDLDLTTITELPTGKKRIRTRVLAGEARKEALEKIRETLAAGKQAFVVYPIIDPSDRLGVRSATEEIRRLGEVLPKRELGLLHGRMSAEDKQDVLDRFSRKEIHVLVTTAVIEVGIDIPEADVMLIEGAERFGLAQLHQLRGRVGRAGQEAFCFLTTDQDDARMLGRLKLMETIDDGFLLAEKDLELRGPGELFGKAQSGFSGDIALSMNSALIEQTRNDAEALLNADPALKRFKPLAQELEKRTTTPHFE
jgi:ATP-dependent DNA helicase RecG